MRRVLSIAAVAFVLLFPALSVRASGQEPAQIQVINHTRGELVRVALVDPGNGFRDMGTKALGPGISWTFCCFTRGATYVFRLSVPHETSNGTSIEPKPDKPFTVSDVSCPEGALIITIDIDSSNSVWVTQLCQRLGHTQPIPPPSPTPGPVPT
jgi:hypothetical protein